MELLHTFLGDHLGPSIMVFDLFKKIFFAFFSCILLSVFDFWVYAFAPGSIHQGYIRNQLLNYLPSEENLLWWMLSILVD